jgi:hypothetical protein
MSSTSKPLIGCFCKDPSFPELIETIILKKLNADFFPAYMVKSAISALEGHHFDLVITGHLFEDGTSQQILSWLQGHEAQGAIPCILLSSIPKWDIPHHTYSNFHYLSKGHLASLYLQVTELLYENKSRGPKGSEDERR